MLLRHYFLILIITFLFGSAYPVQKVIFNENVPPLLMGSLRMLVVFICLLPFWRFRIPEKKYWLPLSFSDNYWFSIGCTICNIIKLIFFKRESKY